MDNYQEFLDTSTKDCTVQGYLHTPARSEDTGLILTHGAGANCNSPLLIALAEAFCAFGWTVLRCDLPFRQLRPQGPPSRGSAERDQQGLKAAVASMRNLVSGRVFLGGHSYGGRVASMLAASEPGLVEDLLLLSYPLHPPKRPEELRTGHFPNLQTPAFFAHGTCDGFGSISEMQEALKRIPAPTELLQITGAGHELLKSKNRDTLLQSVTQNFRIFTD